jgi:sugar phosphate isomerase/epimerase
MIRRSIIAAGKLAVPGIVIHPGTVPNSTGYKESLCKNYEYYKPHVELALKHGTGILIENLFDKSSGEPNQHRRLFSADPDEIIELTDMLSAEYPNVGICWDTGHANIMGVDQAGALRKIGKRLKGLHVHDNNGVTDDHALPYSGEINWTAFMQALKEINYTGDFTFEHDHFTRYMPEALLDEALRLSLSAAKHLIAIMNL